MAERSMSAPNVHVGCAEGAKQEAACENRPEKGERGQSYRMLTGSTCKRMTKALFIFSCLPLLLDPNCFARWLPAGRKSPVQNCKYIYIFLKGLLTNSEVTFTSTKKIKPQHAQSQENTQFCKTNH